MSSCEQRELFIPGPQGRLEAVLECPAQPSARLLIACHPHTQYGGSLTNKVVHTVAAAALEAGVMALRFNFRGAGQSVGEFDEGMGETDDLLWVQRWAQENLDLGQIILTGFSFGAYVSLRAAQHWQPTQLILIAPPVNLFDFGSLHAPDCPVTVIQGEVDELVPASKVAAWTRHYQQVEYQALPGVDHFFHGRLALLRARISNLLQST